MKLGTQKRSQNSAMATTLCGWKRQGVWCTEPCVPVKNGDRLGKFCAEHAKMNCQRAKMARAKTRNAIDTRRKDHEIVEALEVSSVSPVIAQVVNSMRTTTADTGIDFLARVALESPLSPLPPPEETAWDNLLRELDGTLRKRQHLKRRREELLPEEKRYENECNTLKQERLHLEERLQDLVGREQAHATKFAKHSENSAALKKECEQLESALLSLIEQLKQC